VTINITAQGGIGEQLSENVNLTEEEPFKKLQKNYAKAITDEVNAALNTIQKEWGVDIFGFGKAFYRKYPKEWKKLEKNWDEEIKNITVNVQVDARINSVGMSLYPESYQPEE